VQVREVADVLHEERAALTTGVPGRVEPCARATHSSRETTFGRFICFLPSWFARPDFVLPSNRSAPGAWSLAGPAWPGQSARLAELVAGPVGGG
jgi:hypothetical protein